MICLNQTAYSGKESPPASNGMVWRVNASTGEGPRFAPFLNRLSYMKCIFGESVKKRPAGRLYLALIDAY